MDNKFWMNVFAVIVAMLLMSWVVRPVLGGVLGVKEGYSEDGHSVGCEGACRFNRGRY